MVIMSVAQFYVCYFCKPYLFLLARNYGIYTKFTTPLKTADDGRKSQKMSLNPSSVLF
jgi:hypothetical protein